MDARYDKKVDAMYIRFNTKKPLIKKTLKLNEEIMLDIGEDEKIVGIEILGASNKINKKEIELAKITA